MPVPNPERNRDDDLLIDRVREFVLAGMPNGFTYLNVLDAQTSGNERLPSGEYLAIQLGDVILVSQSDILEREIDDGIQPISRSWQEFTAYIDFVNFPDPFKQAQLLSAWIDLQEASTAAYQVSSSQVSITPVRVLAIRDITDITTGKHEKRAQMELRFGMVTEYEPAPRPGLQPAEIIGKYSDGESDIDIPQTDYSGSDYDSDDYKSNEYDSPEYDQSEYDSREYNSSNA
ncbi:MAG: hypothetical protein OXI23_16075 [Gemmatimonadota bacterium]|nr:hypothetical protein [Gemmatimonadota bacterium]